MGFLIIVGFFALGYFLLRKSTVLGLLTMAVAVIGLAMVVPAIGTLVNSFLTASENGVSSFWARSKGADD